MQQDNNSNQKKSNALGWLFLGLMLAIVVASLLVNLMATRNITMNTNFSLFFGEFIMVIPGIVYILIYKLDLREDIGFKKIKVSTIFLSVLLGFLVLPLASFVNILSQFFVPNTMVQASDALISSGNTILLIFISSFFGPFCEEFIFRGVFHRGYDRVATPLKAILMASLMFGLMHMNLNQACYAFVLGIVFAIVNKASGSIYTSMIIHTVVNFVNMSLLLLLSFASSATGVDFASETENVRNTANLMYVMAGVYLVLAIIFTAIMIPVVVLISSIEGHTDELRSIFFRKRVDEAEDDRRGVKVFTTVSGFLSIAFGLFIIFGLDYLMSLLGWV